MEQKEFSELIIEFLKKNHSEFTQKIKFQDNGSFDCDLKSESGIFSIWVATYNCEITVGIEDPNGKTDIHTHIPCYGSDDFKFCITELSALIEKIKTDKVVLYQDKNGNYNWTELSKFENLDNCKKFSWKKQ